jgi:hypothetical protein
MPSYKEEDSNGQSTLTKTWDVDRLSEPSPLPTLS